MFDIYKTVIRSLLLIAGLFLITKLLGKKQLSGLSFFEYIVGITVGDIAGTLSMDPDLSLKDGVASIIVWSFIPFIMSVISLKSKGFRNIVEGTPTTFVENGNIIERNLKKEKYSLDELLEQLRKKSVFKLADVEFASLDSNGELSVLLKKAKQPVTNEGVTGILDDSSPPIPIIMDGKFVKENIEKYNLSPTRIGDELRNRGFKESDVFYAELYEDGKMKIDAYDKADK